MTSRYSRVLARGFEVASKYSLKEEVGHWYQALGEGLQSVAPFMLLLVTMK